jgi:transcriptional adapter 2-alpha
MPGRLEFEHELDNEAEMAVKDMEFGLVWRYGGDEQPQAQVTRPPGEDGEEDEDEDEEEEEEDEERGEKKKKEEVDVKVEPADEPPDGQAKSSPSKKDKGKGKAQQVPVVEAEDEDELEVKLALLDIYFSKLDKREEAKDIIFDRGLTEHKKVSDEAGVLTDARRSWPMSGNDRKRSGSSSIDTRSLQSYKRPRTLRCSLKA